jgi:hypothetical protein
MMVSATKKAVFFSVGFLLLSMPHSLFAGGVKNLFSKEPQEIKVVTDMQDRYAALTVPALIMLPVTASSAVPGEITQYLGEILPRRLVSDGKLRPVTMQKWLFSTFNETKAKGPFELLDALKAERYTVPLQYIGKPYIFKCENYFVLTLDLYPFATYYPVTTVRFFAGKEDLDKVLTSCLDELYARLASVQRDGKKRVVVQGFKLDFLKLVALESGEFEFIPTPFIEQHAVALREGDDYFSRILAYTLASTNLFQSLRTTDFADYAEPGVVANRADYVIQGRVQLSAEMCVLYVDLFDSRETAKILSIKYPLERFSLKDVWDAYQDVSTRIVSSVYGADTYGKVSTLTEKGRGFYLDSMFIGWDTLENFILPKGMYSITTGSYYRAETTHSAFESVKRQTNPGVGTYFIFLDTLDHVFTDRDGEYAWNLLKK